MNKNCLLGMLESATLILSRIEDPMLRNGFSREDILSVNEVKNVLYGLMYKIEYDKVKNE